MQRNQKDAATLATLAPFFLDFGAVCRLVGREPNKSARIAFWRGAKSGTFPAPVKLSEARIAWKRDEVEAWLVARPRVTYAGESASIASATEADVKGR